MNDRKTCRYDIFGRFKTFGADNAANFAAAQKAAATALIAKFVAHELPAHFVSDPDAIIHNKYARNRDKLRAWESASHIERAPRKGR